MVDIHTHILPGMDDGAQDIYDMLDMAQLACESGTTVMVATPHCNIPGFYENYYSDSYEGLILQCRELLKKEHIPLTVLPGMEVFVTENLPDLIRRKAVIPINRQRYILIEFDFDENPDFAQYMLPRIRDTGLIPVIAHVERYHFIWDYPELIYEWKIGGYEIQVNKGSFIGRFGDHAHVLAYDFLDRNLITAIASDAHSPLVRTPRMDDVYDYLLQKYPADYLDVLFEENPQRICNGKSTVRFRYISFEDGDRSAPSIRR